MADQVVTTVHKTTTTTTTTSGSGVRFQFGFLKSLHGMMVFLEAFYAFIAFIVIITGTTNYYLGGTYGFFITVTMVCWFYSGVTYVFLLLNLRSKVRLPWNLLDVFAYFILLVLTITASSLVISNGVLKASGSAGTLGFVVAQLYLVSFFLAIQDYRYQRSMTQQGEGAMGQSAPTQDVPPLGF